MEGSFVARADDSVAVGNLSESEILKAFMPILEAHNAAVEEQKNSKPQQVRLNVGPGDDCSVLEVPASSLVFTTDTQTENQDFRTTWNSGDSTGGFDVGWKAGTQNLADVGAMGATPITLLVSLSLPPTTSLRWVIDFARGLVQSCVANGADSCSISGGDLGSSSEVSVTVTAIGQCVQPPVLRSGAQDGDVLAIAGEIGTAAAGFEVMEYSPHLSTELRSSRPEAVLEVVEAQQRPVSALTAGQRAAGIAHAMMDISDGPIRDAQRLAKASGVCINVETKLFEEHVQRLVPVAQWLIKHAPVDLLTQDARTLALRWILSGGENHGMLACFPPDIELPAGFRRVGKCNRSETSAVLVDGKAPEAMGWDHFSTG